MRSLTPFRPSPHKAATALPTFRTNAHRIILSTLFALLTALSSSAQPTAYFKLVTSNDELVAGEKYIICNCDAAKNYVYIMKNYESGNNCGYDSQLRENVEVDGMFPALPSSAVITLTGESGEWGLMTDDNTYLTCKANSNYLKTTKEQDNFSTFSISIDGYALIKCLGQTSYSLQYNKSNGVFSAYKTAQSPIYLYRYYSDYYTRGKNGKNNYATICLPTNASDLSKTYGTFYNIVGKTMENNDVTGIVIEETSRLEAGKGYIFKYNEDTKIVAIEHQGETTDVAIENKGLIGNLSKETKTVPIGCYILKNDEIQKNATSSYVTIGQYRAYIDLTKVSEFTGPLSSKMVRFDISDDTTHISDIKHGNDSKPQKTYNTLGTLVDESYKGITIYGGRKILRR